MLRYRPMDNACTFDWSVYKPEHEAVLCFLRNGQEILLIHKKRGLGAGKVNGPGGKKEPEETLVETAVRETREEIGLTPLNPRHRGILRFAFSDGYNLEVHVFMATSWTGRMIETDEALPFWVKTDQVPYDTMWQDDRYWLPAVIDGHSVEAEMFFEGDTMRCWDIRFSNGVHVVGPGKS